MQHRPQGPYVFGDDEAESREAARSLVVSYLGDQLDNGPGWVVTHDQDAYDIRLTVKLTKKPPYLADLLVTA